MDKLNRVDAVHAIDLFHKIVGGAATHADGFAYVAPQARSRRGPARPPAAEQSGSAPVSFGARVADAEDGGVGLTALTGGGAAEEAGLEVGDRLVKWNSSTIGGRDDLRARLEKSTPGEKVQVTVMRAGAEKVYWVTLKER